MSTTTIRQPGTSARRDPSIQQTFILLSVQGLHTRPATLLARTLDNYKCQVLVECGGGTANARSIFGLLTLAAGYGSKLRFTATGADAAQALIAVRALFKTNFRDAYAGPVATLPVQN